MVSYSSNHVFRLIFPLFCDPHENEKDPSPPFRPAFFPDPFLCLDEEPNGDKIEDQKYQRELSKRYIALRQKKAKNIVRAVQLGKYDPMVGELKAAKFIAEDQCVASRYLTFQESFLLSTAISDHFDLPFSVPAELDSLKYHFSTLFPELAENDLEQAMEIWDWCLDTFQPYLEYTDYKSNLTSGILIDSDHLPNEFPDAVVDYMVKHPAFIDKLIGNGVDIWHPVDEFIIVALERGNLALAKKIFSSYLQNQNSDIHCKILVISGLVDNNCYYKNMALLERFREHLFPMVCELTDPRIKNKIRGWEQEMEDRIHWTDEENEPEDIEEDKYAWRRYCTRRYDLDPANYETREAYNEAVAHAHEQERLEKEKAFYESPDSTKLFSFCMVSIDFPRKPHYYYFPGAEPLAVGDKVLVPFGAKDEEKTGVVVSVGECYAVSLPCPIDKIKTVIRKLKA